MYCILKICWEGGSYVKRFLPCTLKVNKGHRKKLSEVVDMFLALMVAMVSSVYTCPQTCWVVYIKYSIFYVNRTSISGFKKVLWMDSGDGYITVWMSLML